MSPLASWFFVITICGFGSYAMLAWLLDHAAKHEFDKDQAE